MAYIKTDWKARIGSLLNRFFKEQETDRSVVLHNQPLGVTQAGTPVSIQNLNKIEQGIFDAHELVEIVTQKVLNIISKIPNHASANNQLADKNFVNSSISNMAANYVTPDAAGEQQWTNLETLRAGPWFHGGTPYSPTQNDYAIFINDDNSVWRATFDGNLWSPTYKVNDTPFTAAQLAALNSQITASLVLKILNPDTVPTKDSDNLITSGAVFSWFGAGSEIFDGVMRKTNEMISDFQITGPTTTYENFNVTLGKLYRVTAMRDNGQFYGIWLIPCSTNNIQDNNLRLQIRGSNTNPSYGEGVYVERMPGSILRVSGGAPGPSSIFVYVTVEELSINLIA